MEKTIYQDFVRAVGQHQGRTALMHKRNGRYQSISFRQLSEAVDQVAAGLARRGVKKDDRVAIYSYNRPEWVVADLAIIKLGAVVVPIYHTLPSEAVSYIIRDAEVRHLVVETPELFSTLVDLLDRVPGLKDIVTLFSRETETRSGKELFSFDSLRKAGAKTLAQDPDLGKAHVPSADDVVTVVYTSGTTGEPKGTMLTHGNILSNVRGAIERFGINEKDTLVSFLPLCHMFERTCGYYTMLLAGASIAYAESLDTIRADVQAVRPTLLIVVPRVLEKVYNAVVEKVTTGSALGRSLMLAALRTFSRTARLRAKGRPWPLGLRFRHWLLGRLVVRKLRALAGGRVRIIVSGGAPLDRRLARIIRNLEFDLVEGYGLTETSPVVCAAMPGENKVGTVGRPLPGVEVRIGENDEVLVRGPNVMKGYLNKPEETAQAIDKHGWFHTGDQGRFDNAGNLIITGRIKELIVTAYGKNIPPVPVEQAISGSEYVEQAMVIGDRKPFLSALIVPSRLVLEGFAREKGIPTQDFEALLGHPEVVSLFRQEMDRALENFAKYEQVRAFRLLPDPFTVENGLLTPSLKMRRPRIALAYRDRIEKMYQEQ
ncbi:MAG: long-chain fatty acid--CoA ligase [candidate division WOR-3 bacterium]|nr:MAG: long-chain fatty acid--CoA ligase [candidate division WOR-3 bacterium]